MTRPPDPGRFRPSGLLTSRPRSQPSRVRGDEAVPEAQRQAGAARAGAAGPVRVDAREEVALLARREDAEATESPEAEEAQEGEAAHPAGGVRRNCCCG